MWNDNIVLNIYGFTIEDIFYIEFFSRDLKMQATPSQLLDPEGRKARREQYNTEKTNRLFVTGIDEIGNKDVLLKAKQYLFFYLKVIRLELSAYFEGQKTMNFIDHLPIEKYHFQRLNLFFDSNSLM
jgi:hypothetical protein